jgi:hypothetical protein
MCGIIGLILGDAANDPDVPSKAAMIMHEALYYLQHRGQDSCGIATCTAGGRIFQCKGNGMAGKVGVFLFLHGFCDEQRSFATEGEHGVPICGVSWLTQFSLLFSLINAVSHGIIEHCAY